MIPVKQIPNGVTTIRKPSIESIINWFDQHKQSFYALGSAYLRNQKLMEELFYQSIIKVHKEMSRFKSENSFEMNVISTFIHICRELSNDTSLEAIEEGEPRQELFKALDSLNKFERETLILTYIKQLSQEDVARLLEISVEELKERLFLGIRSLRKEMGYGSNFNGCKEYHDHYIDYLEKKLDRSKKIDFEIHIYHCENCQEDLASFQDVMIFMLNFSEAIKDFDVPTDFMENLKARLVEKERQRKRKIKKRKKIAVGLAGVFLLLIGIGIFTGSFTKLYYTWTEKDPELRKFLQQDLGERLNLKAENNGIKIKIKSVIADDYQTLVFYEVEDTKKDNQYMIDIEGGGYVENQDEIMNTDTYQRYYAPDLKSDQNNKEKNVYYGKFSLLPLIKNKGTIKLSINQLQKIIRDSSERKSAWTYDETEMEPGDWEFEIPVTKNPSVKYALHGETEVEGIPIRFDELIIAPTTTVLKFAINNEPLDKQIYNIGFNNLQINNQKVKGKLDDTSYSNQTLNWIILQSYFDPLFGEEPKDVKVQLNSAQLTFENEKTIELGNSKEYPKTFKYAGSTISIDEVTVGYPTRVVISNSKIKNRAYDTLNLSLVGEDENEVRSTEMESHGILVDKNGHEFNEMNLTPYEYEKIEQPRYLDTVVNITVSGDDGEGKVIPKKLVIHGYNAMRYMEDVVKLKLK